jgi:transketolase
MASRVASGKVLNAIASKLSTLIGGSADLAPSTDTLLKEFESFRHNKPHGRNFHFGVREHAMGAVLNGLALTGGLIPYGATFLIFSDYMKPSIRIAALSEIRSIFVFTHDSIGLGEDGPTHQPVEHLIGLRAIPNLNVIRPFLNEVPFAWKLAIENINGPSAIILTRQKLPNLSDLDINYDKVNKGAYALIDNKSPHIILIASGSEVHLILEAAKKLENDKINAKVISMPSWKLFDMQSDEYKKELFPDSIKYRIAVEAGSSLGWHKYVGEMGVIIGVNKFGASAPGEEVLSNYGFTVDYIVSTAKSFFGKSKEKL